MTVRDFDKDIATIATLVPKVQATGTVVGATVDLAGFTKAAFIVAIGTLVDSTHTFDPEESTDGSTWTNIAAADLSGSFIVASATADDTIYEVGYLGSARYVRCNVVVAAATSSGPTAVLVVKAGARTLPQ